MRSVDRPVRITDIVSVRASYEPKKTKVVNSTLFTSSIGRSLEAPEGEWVEYEPEKNMDLFRYRLGKYWNKSFFGDAGIPQFKLDGLTVAQEIQPSTPQSAFFTKREKITIQSNPTIMAGVTPPPNGPINQWLNFVDRCSTNATMGTIKPTFDKLREDPSVCNSDPKWFYDHAFEYESPIIISPIVKNSNTSTFTSIQMLEASIKPVYNFYIKSYEGAISQSNPHETLMPNFYSFLTVLEHGDLIEGVSGYGPSRRHRINTIHEKHVTLDDRIRDTFVVTEVLSNSGQRTSTKRSKGQYFDKYAYKLKEVLEDQRLSDFRNLVYNKFKNQIVPMDNLNLFTDYNDKALNFPMYVDINFSTDKKTKFADGLKETKLSSILMKDVIQNVLVDPSDPTKTFEGAPMNFNLFSSEPLPFAPPGRSGDAFQLRCWDLEVWFKHLMADPITAWNISTAGILGGDFPGVFLGPFNEEVNMTNNDPSSRFFKNLMVMIFGGKFQKLVDEETRTYGDIVGVDKPDLVNSQGRVIMRNRTSQDEMLMKGPKQAYHESVFYKIEKWEADSSGSPLANGHIQNTYLPNSSDIDVHKFIDSQVKYGKRYVYRIYSYEIVVGTQYKYSLDEVPPPDGTPNHSNVQVNQAKVCLDSIPSIKLVELPYVEKSIIMLDKPPIWPDVNIVPYRGVKNKLLFWLNGNIGNYRVQPIVLEPSDLDSIDAIREAQDLRSSDPIEYKGDDASHIFQIFRITKFPRSYEDFAESKIAEIRTDKFENPCKFASAADFVDTMQPNKKYYYTFRAIDNHGHISNPSPIYETEIVYDAGSPFLQMQTIDFNLVKNPPQTPTINMKRYIRIRPSWLQSNVNLMASGLLEPTGEKKNINLKTDMPNPPVDETGWVHLGIADEQVWGKKFKIRITSSKTGRKVDLNLIFTHKHDRIEPNTDNNLC